MNLILAPQVASGAARILDFLLATEHFEEGLRLRAARSLLLPVLMLALASAPVQRISSSSGA
ncbi:MAG: hypothetical protein WD775_00795 [Burkholderiales bacterium]